MTEIEARLSELKALGLDRRTRLVSGPQGPQVLVDGKPVLLLCSDNYLGLSDRPRVRARLRPPPRDAGAPGPAPPASRRAR